MFSSETTMLVVCHTALAIVQAIVLMLPSMQHCVRKRVCEVTAQLASPHGMLISLEKLASLIVLHTALPACATQVLQS